MRICRYINHCTECNDAIFKSKLEAIKSFKSRRRMHSLYQRFILLVHFAYNSVECFLRIFGLHTEHLYQYVNRKQLGKKFKFTVHLNQFYTMHLQTTCIIIGFQSQNVSITFLVLVSAINSSSSKDKVETRLRFSQNNSMHSAELEIT